MARADQEPPACTAGVGLEPTGAFANALTVRPATSYGLPRKRQRKAPASLSVSRGLSSLSCAVQLREGSGQPLAIVIIHPVPSVAAHNHDITVYTGPAGRGQPLSCLPLQHRAEGSDQRHRVHEHRAARMFPTRSPTGLGRRRSPCAPGRLVRGGVYTSLRPCQGLSADVGPVIQRRGWCPAPNLFCKERLPGALAGSVAAVLENLDNSG